MKSLWLETQPVAIIGAGLMGSLLAWRIARQGNCVQVFERSQTGRPESAAHTAAAMVAPVSERPLCHPTVFKHGLASLQLWPDLLDEVYQDSGIRVSYRQLGSLILAHPADEAEMRQFESDLNFHQLLERDDIEPLNAEQIRQLEPDLATHFERGYWLKSEAQVDNRQLLPALRIAAQKYGVVFHDGVTVEQDTTLSCWSIDRPASTPTGLDTSVNAADHETIFDRLQHQLDSANVLDCRGIGAKSTTENIRGVRGEVLWVEAPECRLSRPVRLLHPRYHLYLVPRSNGQLQLGATEIESEDRSPVSVRSAMEMLSALWCLSPALAEARILSMEANLRPATPDHCPVIEQQSTGLMINGLFRHGYLMAPSLLQHLQQHYELPLGMPAN